MWDTPDPHVILEVRGRDGVQLHYKVAANTHSSCPPRHHVSIYHHVSTEYIYKNIFRSLGLGFGRSRFKLL